jgi:hypothetical protein
LRRVVDQGALASLGILISGLERDPVSVFLEGNCSNGVTREKDPRGTFNSDNSVIRFIFMSKKSMHFYISKYSKGSK